MTRNLVGGLTGFFFSHRHCKKNSPAFPQKFPGSPALSSFTLLFFSLHTPPLSERSDTKNLRRIYKPPANTIPTQWR